jgi:hypothetical protein
MPLTTYEETRPWARAIKEQVLARSMPKWHAARGYGAFANDPTLTPFEIALLVSWVDGGLPRDMRAVAAATSSGATPLPPAADQPPISRPKPPVFDGGLTISLPAGIAELTRPIPRRWLTGWDFEPGEPLITSATLSLTDGTPIGTWAAGDRPVMLPAGSGIRVSGRIRIALHRRVRADYEHEYQERPSVLRLATLPRAPAYRVWSVEGACGSVQGASGAQVIAVTPALGAGGSAQMAIERIGAAPALVGWFRNFDPAFSRTYWLQRPLEFGADARLSSDASCSAAVVLRARR